MSPGDPSRPGRTGPARSVPVSSAWLEVRRPGPLATVQDLGRPGLSHLGVPRAGAADAVALRLANALVGNAPGAAGIEATLAGPELVLSHARAVAVTGAAGGWTVGGIEVPLAATVVVPAGEVVAVRPTQRGVRSYVAVEGGIAVPMVLGSRSSDTLSGLGPAPLSTGTSLPLGPAGELSPWLAAPAGHGSAVVRALPPALAALALGERAEEDAWPVLPGPHLARLGEEALRSLCATTWVVAPASDRTGVRLEAAARPPARPDSGGRAGVGQIPPLGMVAGAVQLPPGGSPIVLLANHATTGGYPVVAVLARAALGRAAQARPGSAVRFRPVALHEAQELLRRLEVAVASAGAGSPSPLPGAGRPGSAHATVRPRLHGG